MRQTIAFLDKSIRCQIEMGIYIAKSQGFSEQTWTIIPPITFDQPRRSERFVLLRSYYTLRKYHCSTKWSKDIFLMIFWLAKRILFLMQ